MKKTGDACVKLINFVENMNLCVTIAIEFEQFTEPIIKQLVHEIACDSDLDLLREGEMGGFFNVTYKPNPLGVVQLVYRRCGPILPRLLC